MISLTGSSSPQDAAGAFAILQVIADPIACKARLDELVKVAGQVGATLAEAEEKMQVAETLEGELAALKVALDNAADELAKGRQNLKADLAMFSQERAALARDVNDNKIAVAAFVEQRDGTQAELSKREMAVERREKRAQETADAAEALQAEYGAKLKQLKQIAA